MVAWSYVFDVSVGAVCLEDLGSREEAGCGAEVDTVVVGVNPGVVVTVAVVVVAVAAVEGSNGVDEVVDAAAVSRGESSEELFGLAMKARMHVGLSSYLGVLCPTRQLVSQESDYRRILN